MIFKLIISLVIILVGAELFTNSIEWLGVKLKLSEGAVGSILAAVGTALPESMIPIVAIFLTPGVDNSHIGIGAILGAPFMLGTLAFFITGFAAWGLPNRKSRHKLQIDTGVVSRDLSFFMIVFAIAVGSSFLKIQWIKESVAILLVIFYLLYVYLTLKRGKIIDQEGVRTLYLCPWKKSPYLLFVFIQVILGLVAIIFAAQVFVGCIGYFSSLWGINPLVLSLIMAPIATELPEKFNSVIWIAQGKDTLALGNITGAMVFQSSIIPAIGIAFTPWQLTVAPFFSSLLVLISALIVLLYIKINNLLKPRVLMFSGFFYLLYISFIFSVVI